MDDGNRQLGAHIRAAGHIIGLLRHIAQQHRAPATRHLADHAGVPAPTSTHLAIQIGVERLAPVALVGLENQFAALLVHQADRAGLGAGRIERPAQQHGQQRVERERRLQLGAQRRQQAILMAGQLARPRQQHRHPIAAALDRDRCRKQGQHGRDKRLLGGPERIDSGGAQLQHAPQLPLPADRRAEVGDLAR